MAGARVLYDKLFAAGLGSDLEAWTNLLALERAYGDHRHGNKGYRTAANTVIDNAEYLFSMWLQFERETGSLADVEDAEARIQKRRRGLAQRQHTVEAKQQKLKEVKRQEREAKKQQIRPERREKRKRTGCA